MRRPLVHYSYRVQSVLFFIGIILIVLPIHSWIARHLLIPGYITESITFLLLLQWGLQRRVPVNPDESKRGFPVIPLGQLQDISDPSIHSGEDHPTEK
jgi:hypothetical protein